MDRPDRHSRSGDGAFAISPVRLRLSDKVLRACGVTTVGAAGCDISFAATGDARWDAVLYVLAAQVWSASWSARLGLNIDNPFCGQGNLTRVVTGVTIYPLNARGA